MGSAPLVTMAGKHRITQITPHSSQRLGALPGMLRLDQPVTLLDAHRPDGCG